MLRHILIVAAVYNVIFGAQAVLFPSLAFEWAQIPLPNYPALWQCIGMIVGVYGVGYAIAWTNPNRHWPIVLVGMMGKVLGPIGFVYALLFQSFPPSFFWVILLNDLIWWPFFGKLLWNTFKSNQIQKI